jgi:hypothetical protein
MIARLLRRRLAAGALLVTLFAAACGPRVSADQEPTTVRVENQNFLDATIYVLRGSQRIRLGNVTGLTTRVLRIPDSIIFGATPLRFIAEPIASPRTPISHEIVVHPGDEIRLVLRGW